MTTINLKDFYSWHTHDEYIEVSDEVAAELRADKLYEAAYQRRIIRNKAQYHERNRYMVLSSDRVIAVYDGRSTGGTFYTIRFAQANEKEIRIIEI